MSKLPSDLKPIDEEKVRRIAHITGDQSASARILKDYDRMKSEGLNPVIGYSAQHNVFVVCDIGHQ